MPQSRQVKIRKKTNIRNQYNQVPIQTQDTILESDTSHSIRPMVSPFPAIDQKVARNRQDLMTDKHATQITNMIHKRSTALERSVKNLLRGLNRFDCTSLTLISVPVIAGPVQATGSGHIIVSHSTRTTRRNNLLHSLTLDGMKTTKTV